MGKAKRILAILGPLQKHLGLKKFLLFNHILKFSYEIYKNMNKYLFTPKKNFKYKNNDRNHKGNS